MWEGKSATLRRTNVAAVRVSRVTAAKTDSTPHLFSVPSQKKAITPDFVMHERVESAQHTSQAKHYHFK